VRFSELVVVGKVTGQSERTWTNPIQPRAGIPLTVSTVTVEEVVTGLAPSQIEVTQTIGHGRGQDGKVYIIQDPLNPPLKVGARYLLFLGNEYGGGYFPYPGQGQYLIQGNRLTPQGAEEVPGVPGVFCPWDLAEKGLDGAIAAIRVEKDRTSPPPELLASPPPGEWRPCVPRFGGR